jgi:hypothetical protein
LVDTVSDFNIIRKDLYNELKHHQHSLTDISAKQADRSKIKDLKEISRKINIMTTDIDYNCIKSQKKFVLSETCSTSCILGMPWCLKHKATFLWEKAGFRLTGQGDKNLIYNITWTKIPDFFDDLKNFFDQTPLIPNHSKFDCRIQREGSLPIATNKIRPISELERTTLRQYLENLLDRLPISASQSEFTSPVILVHQKNKIRVCINFRILNKYIRPDPYPMPLITNIFSKIKAYKWFSKVDLTDAFYNIRVRKEDQ